MSDFDKIFKDLSEEIERIGDRYIRKYLPVQPEHTPEVFEYDVKSYCVLAHASFEEFMEMVSEQIARELKAEFLSKKISLATATLILSYADRKILNEDDSSSQTCFDIVRLVIDDCRRKHSETLRDNHGFALKYMRKVLHPVGINSPKDELKLDSVNKLSEARGSFAHTRSKLAMYGEYKKATKPLSPEDAQKIVSDCLEVCLDITNSAKARW